MVCYTDGESAELFLNGQSLGLHFKNAAQRLERYRIWWHDVPFADGELKVVAYDKDGNEIGTDVIKTAGAFDHYRYDYDNYNELGYVTVTAVDKDGTMLRDANWPIEVSVRGDAKFKGICNGDATSLEVFTEPHMKLFNGQLVVTVEKTSNNYQVIAK